MSPHEKLKCTAGKMSQTSSGGTGGSLGKNGHEREGDRQKGGCAKRNFLALREKENALDLMVNEKLKTAEANGEGQEEQYSEDESSGDVDDLPYPPSRVRPSFHKLCISAGGLRQSLARVLWIMSQVTSVGL